MGKTTTAAKLRAGLAKARQQCLLIDLELQISATTATERRVLREESNCLEGGGILWTMCDGSLSPTREVDQEARDFGEFVFDIVIPRDIAVLETPGHGLPLSITCRPPGSPRGRGTEHGGVGT